VYEAFEAALAASGSAQRVELCLLRGARGKRDALARGLELLRDRAPASDGVFVMMDGDTELEPGALSRVLPLFRLSPPVAALTTNEHARVRGPSWIGEWLALRHGQRHLYNCSIALSGRLLCLTGRYSVFRASCLEPGFIDIVRNDSVEHWLWGRYKLLSGDDKSTWFHLLQQGARLLYAPDVSVITHETITGSALLRTYHNLRRWGGNMVRNSERAIAVGPLRLGWFCWWCLVDQRLSMWTTLIGPSVLAYTLAFRQIELASAYLLWVLCSRFVRALPAFIHGRRLSAFYAPLSVLFDWTGAAIKLWVACFPARQFWQNRGSTDLDSTRNSRRVLERRAMAGLALGCMLAVYAVGVGQLIGVLRPAADFSFIRHELSSSAGSTAMVTALLVLAALAFALRLAPPRPLPPSESSRAQ
jgi:glycosyltransferase Alg8